MHSVSSRYTRRGPTGSPEPVPSMTLLLYHYLLLFTAIYCYLLPLRPEHQYIKVTLVPVLPRHAPENMVGLCQGGHLWQTNHPFPSIIVLVRFRDRARS